jgi:hypothetical protein
VQNEIGLYEVPPHRLLISYEGKRVGVGRELGEARIVSTIFGRAKVHIIRKQDHSGWLWFLAIFAVLVMMAMVAFWAKMTALHTSETSSITVLPRPVKPQTPAAPLALEPKISAPQLPVSPVTMPPHLVPPHPVQVPGKNITAQPIIQKPIPPKPVAQQPVIPQAGKTQFMGQVPAKNPAIASKPKTPPANAGMGQTGLSTEMAHPAKPLAAVPLSIKPAVTEPALQITKTPPARAAEPMPVIDQAVPKAGNNQQPAPAASQPLGASQ